MDAGGRPEPPNTDPLVVGVLTTLTFLGTCGGRFATIFQKRGTGGLHITDRNLLMNIDPGPGALLRMHQYGLDPTKTDAILVSHAHPDHYTDTDVLVQGMTRGGLDKRGTLICARSLTEGAGGYGPCLNPHQVRMPKHVHVMDPGDEVLINDWYSVKATKSLHTDPATIGFQMVLSEGVVSYIPDTALFDGLAEEHRGSDIVVIESTRPWGDHIPHHLAVDQAAEVIKQLRPRLAILTQFGMKMIHGNPAAEAARVADETGIPTIAANDGMRVHLGEEIKISMWTENQADLQVAPKEVA